MRVHTALCVAVFAVQAAGKHSHGHECRDATKCLTMAHCSDRDALYRAGHLCNGFPWYNGGPPLIETLKWDDEQETYTCEEVDGSACVRWDTREDSPGEFEVGHGECTDFADGYCKAWRVLQSEVDHCKDGEWESGAKQQLVDGSHAHQQCCHTSCGDDGCSTVCRNREIEGEYANCVCTAVGHVGGRPYCGQWQCVERDNNGLHAAEYENYWCTLAHATEPLCLEWEGNADSTEEFEVVSCACKLNSTAAPMHCSMWHCAERGTNYQYPDLDFIAFAIIFGLFVHLLLVGLFVCVADSYSVRTAAYVTLPTYVVVVGMTVFIPSVLRGGLIVLLVAIAWVAVLLCVTGALVYREKTK